MPIFFFVIIAIVGLLLIVVLGIYSYRKQEARRQSLSALATKFGWVFDSSEKYDHDDEFSQFSMFTTGDSRFAFNRLLGTCPIGDHAWPMQMGDYHYQQTTGTGKKRRTSTYHFSYLLLTLPYQSVPDLTIREEGFFDRLSAFVGFDDIDFESVEFSKRFHVKGSDKRFVYDVIHPRMMEFLLYSRPLTVDIQSGVCCFTEDRKCWSAEEFESRLGWATEFFEHWPRHLTSTLQS